jgi:indolepyruvate ferredoxin oxidoreductase beta subunit
MKKDIAIAGVGGQGNLFATKILCQYAMDRGLEVLGTETIGAAQRGGSVVSHMRISDKPIYSPLIPAGSADVLIGMESLELLRHLGILNPSGYYIMNLYSVPTMFTNIGLERYPDSDDIVAAAKKVASRGAEIAATYKAAELGNAQMTNVVMVGALAKMDDFFEADGIRDLVAKISPAKFRENNLKGFDAGYQLV